MATGTLKVNIKLTEVYPTTPLFKNQKYTVKYKYTVNGNSVTDSTCSTINPDGFIPISISSSTGEYNLFGSFQITDFYFCSNKFIDGSTLPDIQSTSEPGFNQSWYQSRKERAKIYVDSALYGDTSVYSTVNINKQNATLQYDIDIESHTTPTTIFISPDTKTIFGNTTLPNIKLLSAKLNTGYADFTTLPSASSVDFVTIYPATGAYWYAYANLSSNDSCGIRYKLTDSFNSAIYSKYSYQFEDKTFISILSTWLSSGTDYERVLNIYPYYHTYEKAPYIASAETSTTDLFGKLCYNAVKGNYTISNPDDTTKADLNRKDISPSTINVWDGTTRTEITDPSANKYATYDTLAKWYVGQDVTNAYAKYIQSVSLTLNNGTTDNTHVHYTADGAGRTISTCQKDHSYTATFSITTRKPTITVYSYDLSNSSNTTLPMSFTLTGGSVTQQTFNYDGTSKTNTGALKYSTVGFDLAFQNAYLTEYKHQAQKLAITYQYADSTTAKYQTKYTDANGYLQLFNNGNLTTTPISQNMGAWHDIIAYTTFVQNDQYEVRLTSNNTKVPLRFSYNTASLSKTTTGDNNITSPLVDEEYLGIRPYKSALKIYDTTISTPYSNIYEVDSFNIYKNNKLVDTLAYNTFYDTTILTPTNVTSSDGEYKIEAQIKTKETGNIWKAQSDKKYRIGVNGKWSQYTTESEQVLGSLALDKDLSLSIVLPPKDGTVSYIIDSLSLKFYSTASATSPTATKKWTSNPPSTINLFTYFFKDNTINMSAVTGTAKFVIDPVFTTSTTSVDIIMQRYDDFKPGFTLTKSDGTQYNIAENVSDYSLFTIDSSESVTFSKMVFDCARIVGTNQVKYSYKSNVSGVKNIETSYFDISKIASNPIKCPTAWDANHWSGVTIIPNVTEIKNTSIKLIDESHVVGDYEVSVTDNGVTQTISGNANDEVIIATKVPANTNITIKSFKITDTDNSYEVTRISDGTNSKNIPCEWTVGAGGIEKLYISADRVKADIWVFTEESGDFTNYKIHYTNYNNEQCVCAITNNSMALGGKYPTKTGSNSFTITAIEPDDGIYVLVGKPKITINEIQTDIDLDNPKTLNVTDNVTIWLKWKKDTTRKVFGLNLDTTSWGVDDTITLKYSVVLDNPYLKFGEFSYTNAGISNYNYGVGIDSDKYYGLNNISLPISYIGSNYDTWIADDEAKKLRGHVTIVSNTAGEGNETLYCVDRENYVPFTLAYNTNTESDNDWELKLSNAFIKNVQKTLTYSVFIDKSIRWHATLVPYDTSTQNTVSPTTYGAPFDTDRYSDNPFKLTLSECGIAAENYGVVLKNPQIYNNGSWIDCKYKLGVMGTIIPVEPAYAVVRVWSCLDSMKLSIADANDASVVSNMLLSYYSSSDNEGIFATDVQLPTRGDYKFKVQYWNNTGSLPEFKMIQKTPNTGNSWTSKSCVIEWVEISCNADLNEFYIGI